MPRKLVKIQPPYIPENLATDWLTTPMSKIGAASSGTSTPVGGMRVVEGLTGSSNGGGIWYPYAKVTSWLGAYTGRTYIVTCEINVMTATTSGCYVHFYPNQGSAVGNIPMTTTTELNVWQRVARLGTGPSAGGGSFDFRCTFTAANIPYKFAFRDFAVYDVTDIDPMYYPSIARRDFYAFRTNFAAIATRPGDGIIRSGNHVGIDIASESEIATGVAYKAVAADKLKSFVEHGENYKIRDGQNNEIKPQNLCATFLEESLIAESTSSGAQSFVFDNMLSIWGTSHTGAYAGMYFDQTSVVHNKWIKGDPSGHTYLVTYDMMIQCEITNAPSIFGVGNATNRTVTGVPTISNSSPPHKWIHCNRLIVATGDFHLSIRVFSNEGKPWRVSVKNVEMYDVTNIPEAYHSIIALGQKPLLSGADPVSIFGNTISYLKASVPDVLGGTVNKNYVVDAGTLNSAINIGRAVDVTTGALGSGTYNQISFGGGTTWQTLNATLLNNLKGYAGWKGSFSLRNTSAAMGELWFGFSGTLLFPKRAPDKKYLVIIELRNAGAAITDYGQTVDMGSISGLSIIPGYSSYYPGAANQTNYTRIAGINLGSSGRFYHSAKPKVASTSIRTDVRVWRQYEVTMLDDNAIKTLAGLPADQLDSAYYRYMVKQDAVCPFIPIIDMEEAESVTIQSGFAYKLLATTGTHILTVDTFPEGTSGDEAYISITTASTGTVTVASPLMLMDPIKPNAINNCRIVYMDGVAKMYVDDTSNGYIVITNRGTDEGSLHYGMSRQLPADLSVEYISFSTDTDNTRIMIDGAVPIMSKPVSILGNDRDLTDIDFQGGILGSSQPITIAHATVRSFTLLSGNMTLSRSNLIGSVTLAGGTITFSELVNLDADVTGANIVIVPGTTIAGSGSIDLLQTQGKRPEIKSGVLNGITIKNGKMNGYGGGFWTSGSSDTVDVLNCTITGCSASSSGGGFSFRYTKGSIVNCTITGCTTGSWGGCFETSYNSNASTPNIVRNLYAYGCQAKQGGAIAIYQNKTQIYDSTISHCTSTNYGNAIGLSGASASIEGTLIEYCDGNSVIEAAGTSTVSISGCTIDHCTSGKDTGLLYSTTLTVANTLITNNTVTTGNTGVSRCATTYTNCIFNNNQLNVSGTTGGLIFANSVNVNITGCTFNNNSLYSISLAGTGTVSLANTSILSGAIFSAATTTKLNISGTFVFKGVMTSAGENKFPVIVIESGATINLRQNGAPTPIRGSSIQAQGSFTVIDGDGNSHSYTAATKTNSSITNAGAWN